MKGRVVRAAAALALGSSAACNDPPPRPRPVEVPISEYRVADSPRAPATAASASAAAAPTGALDGEASSVAAVPEEPRDKADKGEASSVATQLDAKSGFLGATFGSSPRQHRGLVAVDKRGETYRAPAKSYGGVALRDVFYVFRRGKLATLQFSAKNNEDCKALREMLTRELGPPQRATPDTALWRGDKVALRFVLSNSGVCSATAVSKEYARGEFDAM